MSPAAVEEVLGRVRIGELRKRRVSRVGPAATLGEVYRRLDEDRSVAVLVCEGEKLLGIFTERDVLYRTAIESGLETPIGELMTRDLVTLTPDDRLADAIRVMSERHIRHVPVVDADGVESGLIGGRDVLQMIAEYLPETLVNLPPRLDQKMRTAGGG
jgi:CBS domain-containing protein